jgi:putative salt-induced outer membrane protein
MAAMAAAIIAQPAMAQAEALPEPVAAMIRHAAETLDDAKLAAVVEAAKATNPASGAEIDALAGRLKAEYAARAEEKRIAELASQGLLDGWSGQGELGVGMTSGNTDQKTAVASLKLRKEGLKTRHSLRALADFQRDNGETSREKFLVGYKFDYKFFERMYAYGTLQWDRDRFAGISRRFTESAGLGYKVIVHDGHSWEVEAGPALQQISYTDGTSENQLAGRASSLYSVALTDTITFGNDTTAFFGASNTSLSNLASLTAKFSDRLSGRLSYLWQRESNPPPGLKKVDTATRATVVYDF